MKTGLLLLAILLPGAQGAQAQRIGVMVGMNFQELSDITFNSRESAFSSHNGWHAGVWAELSVGAVGFRPGVRYMSAGKLFEGISEAFASAKDDFEINLLEFPVLLSYGIKAPVIGPYVFLGPVFRIPTNADSMIADDLKAISYAGEVGMGIEISLGGVSLHPEIAYTFGLTSFIEDELVLERITLATEDTQRLNTAMLRLAVGF